MIAEREEVTRVSPTEQATTSRSTCTLSFFFFFFFFYSSQTPVATGRIVGLSGGGARYTRST